MTKGSTAHIYTVEEVKEAIKRLVRMGMDPEKALLVTLQAFPEFRSMLLH